MSRYRMDVFDNYKTSVYTLCGVFTTLFFVFTSNPSEEERIYKSYKEEVSDVNGVTTFKR